MLHRGYCIELIIYTKIFLIYNLKVSRIRYKLMMSRILKKIFMELLTLLFLVAFNLILNPECALDRDFLSCLFQYAKLMEREMESNN
ncbi:hypothetical protein BpHYR1_045998 [Brachionus plicatilis]|uniref:Uncharacterized protein n=1 Tax=Brachionus plicatilis TaxID=10195 RepID=A0A3M7SIE6_BRAPC|nr:hypothetical protein BpHYR1_045998 [Brachionus plicatilis]